MTTILIIEDTASLQEEILQMLDLMNFRGLAADNGVAGVQLAQQHLPDIILCDIMMPEMDGYDVLQTLRRNPETARIPFIFLTARADRADIRRGMNLGADDYLTKPFTSSDLGEAITARLCKQAAITAPYVLEMKRAAEQLGQMAFRDSLTGLPNRIQFQHRLQEALIQANRNQQAIAVLCVSLERFRAFNVRFGQSAGDALLQSVAERLKTCVTAEDTIARLSGDEFCILLTHRSPEAIERSAEEILKALSAPYLIQEHSLHTQISMGGSIYPNDESGDKLLNHAAIAMNWGREQGNPHCQFYSDEIAETTATRSLLEAGLRRALDKAELQVHYQPQVNLITGRIIGAEAFLRWNSAELGSISPFNFIAVAEETGLIVPIGEWMIQIACLQAKTWQTKHLLPLRMSVNLSAYQFKQPGLVRSIAQILKDTELDAELLAIEISETTVMADVEASLSTLQQIKELGVHISIDDFGTGYSSLNYLTRLPMDTLKIDQAFVKDITTDQYGAAIASAITALAQSLNLRVVAEGVETPEQLAFLRRQGCNALQGFLFSPAISADEFEKLLTEDKRLLL
ncbi:MAG: EAL domain-containing protein [Drouetiella hepatica Uher 2000/2452]|jgi:diguanylate cyclase (GGDEF)-like protein|uniref:EAL domain-containing protein n=1 Tax=Drouetiella hepatica Uher 2000/2452 TaxID=904376 RepID=A0A951UM61_9CYAN|nr:EAL domain-containing protein [Drouetiella hepatica Uher 2000/2452]